MRITVFFYKSLSARIQNDAVLNYLNVVKDRFLPPPISVTRTTTSDIKRVKQDVDAHYLFLTENLALKAQLGATTL